MANYTIDKIEYGSNIYILQDSGALQLTGGQVTGPVTFGDSVSIDDLTAGSLVVNGSASVANNLQVNTINGVTVGSSPKFTDTPMTVTTTGSGNAVTAVTASGNTITVTKGATYSNNSGTITGVKTTAGAHTAINTTSGVASFNVPTTAAHVGIKFGYTTSGNNRAVQQDSSGNLYVVQKDDNTNYYHTTGSWNGLTYTATANGGAGALAFTIPTGTTATTVALGNHTHSGYAASSHNHFQLVTEGDNRGTATTPNSYSNNLVFRGLKTNSSFGAPSSDSYSYVVGLRGWSDSSGGNSHELAFNNTGIYWRNGATTSWGSWYRLLSTQNFNSTSSVGTIGSSKVYAVGFDANGKLAVNVPWTDNNTTYSFSASNPTLAWGITSTIGTAGGTTYKVTMPANPNTDTHYTAHLRTASSASSTSQVTAATSNPYLNLIEESTLRDSVRIVGAGATTVQSSADGKTITITSTDTNTTYTLSGLGGVGTVSASGTAPLTLSASKSGTTVTITGSVADASASAKGVVTTGTQSFKGDKTFQSNTFRIRNENNDNNQAGSNPWITQLNLGDGNYVTMTEYKDDHLAIRGSSILLHTTTAPTVYSNTATYSVGALVWYNKAYYRCITAISTAEEWTAAHWSVLPSSAIMSHANFNPTVDNSYSLGTSSYRWSDVRTVKLNGTEVPSSPKFTDTVYTHPTYTSKSSGLYKITVDGTGHVSATTAVAKSDITGLGIPAQDTTYSTATSSTLGLVKIGYAQSGKNYPVQLSNGQMYVNVPWTDTNYTLPVATQTALGGVKPWYYWNQDSTGPTAGVVGASATVNARSSTSGRYYPIESDKSGRMFVNVPWTDTNTNTDTLVTQAYSTTNNSYPLLMSATAGVSSTSSRGATTAILNNQLYANPSTGTLTLKDANLPLTVTISGTQATGGADKDLYNALVDYTDSTLSGTTMLLKQTIYEGLVRPAIWGGRAIDDDTTVILNKVDKDAAVINFNTSAASGTTEGQIYASLTALGWTDCIV